MIRVCMCARAGLLREITSFIVPLINGRDGPSTTKKKRLPLQLLTSRGRFSFVRPESLESVLEASDLRQLIRDGRTPRDEIGFLISPRVINSRDDSAPRRRGKFVSNLDCFEVFLSRRVICVS